MISEEPWVLVSVGRHGYRVVHGVPHAGNKFPPPWIIIIKREQSDYFNFIYNRYYPKQAYKLQWNSNLTGTIKHTIDALRFFIERGAATPNNVIHNPSASQKKKKTIPRFPTVKNIYIYLTFGGEELNALFIIKIKSDPSRRRSRHTAPPWSAQTHWDHPIHVE